ncbi:MAG: GTPase Era [Pseudobacteriovorax sp.]|nr:GTPase Era [Pseudobacteriovorax sp.]
MTYESGNTKAGYISLVGRPNAGKSTLLNALVGQKIAGVSAKPQTTRNKILGIAHHNDAQLLFLDTPGMHRMKRAATINSLMNREAFSVVEESHLILYLIDGVVGPTKMDETFLQSVLRASEVPVAVMISKSDRLKKSALRELEISIRSLTQEVLSQLEPSKESLLCQDILVVSAKQKTSFLPLLDFIEDKLPESAWLYPEDDLTDRPQRFIVSELIREKVFRNFGEEIPYQTAVRIDEMSSGRNITNVIASIVVARSSQKGMVIGKRASKIKAIGIEARAEIEQLLGQKVFLDLQVKVDANWFNSRSLIAEYSSLDV